MEFSFEYFDFLKSLNSNTSVIQSIAFIGIILLYLPYRLLINLLKQDSDGKMNIMGLLYFFATWLMGAIAVGILSYNSQSGIKMFLVWVVIALVDLLFVIKNSNRLFKAYERFKSRGLKSN